MGRVVLVGGFGYLGYNIAYIHRLYGDRVYIVSRFRSLHRRYFLLKFFGELNVDYIVSDSILDTNLLDRVVSLGDIDMIYLLTGRLSGEPYDMILSHAYIPSIVSRYIARRIRPTFIHISSYYPNPASKPMFEEDSHCKGLRLDSWYTLSKAYGEMLMKRVSEDYDATVYIIRPGLVVGRLPYHMEWIGLYYMALKPVDIHINIYTPLTPADEIAEFARYLNANVGERFNYYNLTPYNTYIGVLADIIRKKLGRSGLRVRLRPPYEVSDVLPAKGQIGFIKSYMVNRGPIYSRRLFESGYRYRVSLYNSVSTAVDSLSRLLKLHPEVWIRQVYSAL